MVNLLLCFPEIWNLQRNMPKKQVQKFTTIHLHLLYQLKKEYYKINLSHNTDFKINDVICLINLNFNKKKTFLVGPLQEK